VLHGLHGLDWVVGWVCVVVCGACGGGLFRVMVSLVHIRMMCCSVSPGYPGGLSGLSGLSVLAASPVFLVVVLVVGWWVVCDGEFDPGSG
jgi:hypothetical protein